MNAGSEGEASPPKMQRLDSGVDLEALDRALARQRVQESVMRGSSSSPGSVEDPIMRVSSSSPGSVEDPIMRGSSSSPGSVEDPMGGISTPGSSSDKENMDPLGKSENRKLLNHVASDRAILADTSPFIVSLDTYSSDYEMSDSDSDSQGSITELAPDPSPRTIEIQPHSKSKTGVAHINVQMDIKKNTGKGPGLTQYNGPAIIIPDGEEIPRAPTKQRKMTRRKSPLRPMAYEPEYVRLEDPVIGKSQNTSKGNGKKEASASIAQMMDEEDSDSACEFVLSSNGRIMAVASAEDLPPGAITMVTPGNEDMDEASLNEHFQEQLLQYARSVLLNSPVTPNDSPQMRYLQQILAEQQLGSPAQSTASDQSSLFPDSEYSVEWDADRALDSALESVDGSGEIIPSPPSDSFTRPLNPPMVRLSQGSSGSGGKHSPYTVTPHPVKTGRMVQPSPLLGPQGLGPQSQKIAGLTKDPHLSTPQQMIEHMASFNPSSIATPAVRASFNPSSIATPAARDFITPKNPKFRTSTPASAVTSNLQLNSSGSEVSEEDVSPTGLAGPNARKNGRSTGLAGPTTHLRPSPMGLAGPTARMEKSVSPAGLAGPTTRIDGRPTGLASSTAYIRPSPVGLAGPTTRMEKSVSPTGLAGPTRRIDGRPTGLAGSTAHIKQSPAGLTGPTTRMEKSVSPAGLAGPTVHMEHSGRPIGLAASTPRMEKSVSPVDLVGPTVRMEQSMEQSIEQSMEQSMDQSLQCPPPPNNTPVGNSFVTIREDMVLSQAQIEADLIKNRRAALQALDMQAGRAQHNAKERARRARIKMACDAMRRVVPGMTDRTDKATVFEYAYEYIKYLRRLVGDKWDVDFLKKTTPLLNIELE